MSEKSNVPALERGLDILEFVATSGQAGYSQIIEELGLPPASAARILKYLCQRDYLKKDSTTGEYRLGRAPGKLQAGGSRAEDLLEAGRPVLDQLCERTGQTAILFYWTGVAWECIAKATHENALTMQSVGEVRVDIFNYPWGVFAYRQLASDGRKLVLKCDEGKLEKALRQFERKGCVASKGRQFNRYAVPILAADGSLLGALAMGAIHGNDDLDESAITSLLVQGGKQIEEQIRR